MDQRRLPGGFCLNSLDIPLVESVEMNWKDWPQQLRNKNHFFLTSQSSTTSSAITYTGVVTLGKDITVAVHPFMTHCFYCGQDCTQDCAWAQERQMLPLGVLAWETFWENYSAPPQVASERRASQTKVLVV